MKKIEETSLGADLSERLTAYRQVSSHRRSNYCVNLAKALESR